MPLPLILGAAALVTAAYGAKKGWKSQYGAETVESWLQD